MTGSRFIFTQITALCKQSLALQLLQAGKLVLRFWPERKPSPVLRGMAEEFDR